MPESIAYEPKASDILFTIVAMMGEEAIKEGRDRVVFRAHNYEWQEIIRRFQLKYPLLNCFVFSDRGPELFSPVLDGALLVNLQRFDAGDWEVFVVKQQNLDYFNKEIKPRLTQDELRQAAQIAEEFRRIIPQVPER